MATTRDVHAALTLLQRANYDLDTVGPEHHRLYNKRPQFSGAVENWLAGIPAPDIEALIDRLFERIGGADYIRAERLLAVLTHLLPTDDRLATVATLKAHSREYGHQLDLVAAEVADRTLARFARTPHPTLTLVDTTLTAARLLAAHGMLEPQLLYPQVENVLLVPVVRAVTVAVATRIAHDGLADAGTALANAATEAGW